jgi:Zn-dependent protease with chaperone function
MRRKFPQLSSLAYQHPQDLEALEALKKVPFAAVVFRKLSEHLGERAHLIQSMGDHLRLGPRQLPKLFGLVKDAAETLEVAVPQVFVATSPEINAFASGMHEFSITLTSGLLDSFSEDELRFVVGHELSHIKCEHMLYQTVARNLGEFGAEVIAGALGVAGSVLTEHLYKALLRWQRSGELSCDRAGLLVAQDVGAAAKALVKLGGFPGRVWAEEIDYDEVLAQAREHLRLQESFVGTAVSHRIALTQTHPFPIHRVSQLVAWAESDYPRMISGKYVTHAQAARLRAGPLACPRCGATVRAVDDACAGCGQALRSAGPEDSTPAGTQTGGGACTACGHAIEPNWKFCRRCGAPQGTQKSRVA